MRSLSHTWFGGTFCKSFGCFRFRPRPSIETFCTSGDSLAISKEDLSNRTFWTERDDHKLWAYYGAFGIQGHYQTIQIVYTDYNGVQCLEKWQFSTIRAFYGNLETWQNYCARCTPGKVLVLCPHRRRPGFWSAVKRSRSSRLTACS